MDGIGNPGQREGVIILINPVDEFPAAILGYPMATALEVEKRRSHLHSWGITSLWAVGPKNLGGFPVLGLGYVGVVVLVPWQGKSCALKIRRLDSNHQSLIPEMQHLQKANQSGIGPRLLKGSADFLLMEYVAGRSLLSWLQDHQGAFQHKARQAVVKNILTQAFALDQVGLDRGDMGCLTQDVIVDDRQRPVLLDFSGASLNRRPQNLTSALQGLFWGSILAEYVAPDFPQGSQTILRPHLRRYKQQPTELNFQAIMAALLSG
ncbi:hypothetical protein [Picosynechococcus sp. NKBG15041c]|uniref:hypothetical protein n=1 Tax=Picosynechococcus sp. NKBG15041c TaxID=1407650 RepID=UPI0004250E05|nr:hypothetical protein [Picosynechococcus sp. NKBG15041c]